MRRAHALAGLLAVLVIGALLLWSNGSAHAEIRWPINLTYRVTHLEYAQFDSALVSGRFEFAGASWQAWTNRPLSRDASCIVKSAQGPVYVGTPSCGGFEREADLAADAGFAPNAWLNGRSISEYRELGFVEADENVSVDLPHVDRQSTGDLAVLVVEDQLTCSDLGYLECGADDTTRDYRATVVIHVATGIPLLNEERLGEMLLSRYEVERVDAIETYEAPAGLPER